MFLLISLQFFGFVLTSILTAVFILYKLTGDLYPQSLKRFLYRTALRNWQSSLRQTVNLSNVQFPACTRDTGILPTDQEIQLETPRDIHRLDDSDDLLFYGIDDKGNGLMTNITRLYGGRADGTVNLYYNGTSYKGTVNGQSQEFSVGSLKLEMVEAMRRWRLWFNGILQTDDGKFVHVTLNLLWKPLNGPSDLCRDANVNLLANSMAFDGKFGQHLLDFPTTLPEGYTQFGALHGIVKIEQNEQASGENQDPFYLYGFRLRQSLRLQFPSSAEQKMSSSLELFVMCGVDGNAFRVSASDGNWIDGVVAHVSSKMFPITNIDVPAQNFQQNQTLPKLFTVQGSHGGEYRIELWPSFSSSACSPKKLVNREITLLTLTMNGIESRGILLRTNPDNRNHHHAMLQEDGVENGENNYHYALSNSFLMPQQHGKQQKNQQRVDVVDLNSEKCLDIGLVGGKGASLARLAQFSDGKHEFRTAKGFCVTTTFFQRTLNLEEFRQIFQECTTTTATEPNFVEACSRVQKLILENDGETVTSLVSLWMDKVFEANSKDDTARFAVRSSGTLEDGEDLSCAGQNETFLGVRKEDVATKVVQCWASLFTPQSVQYRLNHGQPAVRSDCGEYVRMGVVVQSLVNASSAGVIFTADPISGNPLHILINANYGLGESVVSASCDPDTIRLRRPRLDGLLMVAEKLIGEKKSKVVVNDEGSGCVQVAMSGEEAKLSSVQDEFAIRLGQIAVELEGHWGGKPLDIEWAQDKENNVYILQSRNITSLDAWTDFEIIHEMDTALRTRFERLTNANTGEVMPGATSQLGLSVMTRVLDFSIQNRFLDRYGEMPAVTCIRSCAIARQRILLNIFQILYRHNDLEIQPQSVAIDLSLFGHIVINEEFHRYSVQRWGYDTSVSKFKNFAHLILGIATGSRQVERVAKKYDNYRLNIDDVKDDLKALYERITTNIFDTIDICKIHCGMSEASGGTQILSFLFLSEGKKVEDWDNDLFNDVSKILSVCKDVESADIPNAMDKLAGQVIQEGENAVDQVTTKSAEEAYQFIRNHPTLSQSLNEFMKKHGHRCIFELDLMRQSWETEPVAFIGLLQSIVSSKSKFRDSWKSNAKSQYPSDDALLDSLKTPIKSTTRRILKFILPYCRSSVWNREKTKSLLVWVTNQLKLAYNRLAVLMVQEQLIQDPKLLYFLTHGEIGQLIQKSSKSARILYKAMRRQKLHPSLDDEEFEEIMMGVPEPLDKNKWTTVGDSIKATPVSSGKVQGTIKVCRSVEDASKLIQPGDILVTHSTDIGWSPFFPILGGVVTELGGLISHGAVVAREYGLPCIVGAAHATKLFQTGDLAILDASQGTLTKVTTTN